MKRYDSLMLLGFLWGIWGAALSAQHHDEALHTSEHPEHGIWETIATGIVSFPLGEGEAIAGTEVHLTYWMTHHYGTGLSYTARFAHEAVLNDVALLASWNPLKWMTVNAGPNFAFAAEERPFAVGAYAETEINWRFHQHFHIGPVLGTVISTHTEASVGLHFGIEW